MPGPRQSLDDYVRDRVAQLYALGGDVGAATGTVDDERGEWATLQGVVAFGEFNLGLLSIFEDIERGPDGIPHRRKYAYHCAYDQAFLFRHDFDPVVHPDMPYHKHLPPDGRRVEWERVTLQEAVDEFWPLVTDRDEERRLEESD
jgi:hypothetical protein